MIRDSKVGDTVGVIPFAGKEPIPGLIVSIDSKGLRRVATANGHTYATPEEMTAVEGHPPLVGVLTADLRPGDRVLVFNGLTRTVESVQQSGMVPAGSPARLVVEFVENDKPLTMYARQTCYADEVWLRAPEEEAPSA